MNGIVGYLAMTERNESMRRAAAEHRRAQSVITKAESEQRDPALRQTRRPLLRRLIRPA
ncbi:MAG TPA: hypothetical protein VF066_10720 [Thermoleophilaceae bacterium]